MPKINKDRSVRPQKKKSELPHPHLSEFDLNHFFKYFFWTTEENIDRSIHRSINRSNACAARAQYIYVLNQLDVLDVLDGMGWDVLDGMGWDVLDGMGWDVLDGMEWDGMYLMGWDGMGCT